MHTRIFSSFPSSYSDLFVASLDTFFARSPELKHLAACDILVWLGLG